MKAVSLSVYLLLVMSCVTTKTEIIYKVPDYVLPVFPVCSEYDVQDDDWIVVPVDWFLNVAKFKNEYKEFCTWYNNMKFLEVEK